jgi:hypothetical protein
LLLNIAHLLPVSGRVAIQVYDEGILLQMHTRVKNVAAVYHQ